MNIRHLLLSAAVLVTAARFAGAQPAGASDPGAPAKIGRWTVRFERGGLFLDFDAVPLIRGGIVQLFSPEYKRGYYSSGSNSTPATVETLPDGGRAYTAEYRYAAEGNSFRASQRIEVRPDNTVRLTLRSRWDGTDPALLEWNSARLWAYPLLGAPFEATPSGSNLPSTAQQGRVPMRASPGRTIANRVAENWSRLLLHLPALGDLTFADELPAPSQTPPGASASPPDAAPTPPGTSPASPGAVPKSQPAPPDSPVLLDGRSDPYLQSDRVFWLGFPSVTLIPGQERVLALTVSLAPRSDAPIPYAEGPSEELAARVVAIRGGVAQDLPPTDLSGHPVLIPQPKHVAFTPGDFVLRGRVPLTMALPSGAEGDRAARAARDFAAEMTVRTGVRWSERRLSSRDGWNRRGLLVTTLGAEALPQPSTPALSDHPEGYALVVTPRFAAIVGRDPAGAFYGLQTLRQLLRTDTVDGKRSPPRFAGADVTDWPSLRMRAAHIFVGKEALPFHRNLIDRIFSRYKMNTLVIECEYTRWKSHPEIWQPYSMDPDDLRQEIAYARDRFMEPIPLINSLGHSEWIFKNGQHLDLAEDVKSPHAYDASNPDTYKFLFSVWEEALDIFKPRYFHIGHDEVHVPSYDQFGKYPARPENIAKGAAALFIEDTNRLADWLKPRGVAPILWADMLLHASEGDKERWPTLVAANAPSLMDAEKMRGQLPKDAVIADWRYDAGSERRNGLDIFHSAGHEVIGSAWFSPENIRGWARQCIEKDALGTLQTTWAGYDSKELLLDEDTGSSPPSSSPPSTPGAVPPSIPARRPAAARSPGAIPFHTTPIASSPPPTATLPPRAASGAPGPSTCAAPRTSPLRPDGKSIWRHIRRRAEHAPKLLRRTEPTRRRLVRRSPKPFRRSTPSRVIRRKPPPPTIGTASSTCKAFCYTACWTRTSCSLCRTDLAKDRPALSHFRLEQRPKSYSSCTPRCRVCRPALR